MTAPTIPDLRPRSELEDNEDSQAPLEDFDPRLWWQKRNAAREQRVANATTSDQISPLADSIGLDQITARLQPIQDIGQKALVGNQLAAQAKAQREEQRRAAEAERARMQTYQDALNSVYSMGGMGQLNMMAVQQGAQNGAAGWGTGGAQGVANLMRQVGFPESAIAEGLAISRAESGWNPAAQNRANRNGSTDDGLWQINTIHRNAAYYPKNVRDPLESTKAAFAIWQSAGGKWTPWTVYNSGAYRKFLQPVPPVQKTAAWANPTVMMGNTAVSGATGQLRMTAVQKGMNYVASGVRYVWGGNNLAKGVDCSGLVQQIYKQLGLNLPRTAQQQAFYGTKRAIGQLVPGDLVAWNNGGSRGLQVGHIAIYAGNNEIIESYSAGKPARRRKLSASEVNSGHAWGVHIDFPGEVRWY